MIDLHEGVAEIFASANPPRETLDEDGTRHDNYTAHFLTLKGTDDAYRPWEKELRVNYVITPIAPVGGGTCPRCGGYVEVRLGCRQAFHSPWRKDCGAISLAELRR